MTETAHLSGNSDRSIVLVHGRGCKPAASDYLELMNETITAGLEQDWPEVLEAWADTSKFLAYYGDLSNEFLQSQGRIYDEALDINDLKNALYELKTVDRKKGFGVAKYDRLPGKSAYREFAVSVFAPLVAALGLGKRLISGGQKDLAEYWSLDSAYRDAVLRRVRDTIETVLDNYERVVVLCHGTGSIVTFDALWQLSHEPEHNEALKDAKVDVLLSVGSPLGDTLVRHQLLGRDREGRECYPTNVLAWHNVSAEDDYMSHDNTVADDFKAMLSQRQISSIRDYHIYNMTVRYGRSNPHNILGYLIHPRVAKILADWIAQAYGRPLPKNAAPTSSP